MGYAILTRYAGPTYARGSRIIATGPALTSDSRPVRAVIGWDYGLSNDTGHSESEANHRAGALAIVEKLRAAGWRVGLAAEDWGATLPDESGMVFRLVYNVDEPDHPGAVLTGGTIPAHRPGAYPSLSCCGGRVELVEAVQS